MNPVPATRGVFGLRFSGDPLPGLHPGAVPEAPNVQVTAVDAQTIDDRWRAAESPERLFSRGVIGEPAVVSVDRDERLGFRVYALDHGTHLISPDGTRLTSAIPPGPPWRAMRLLGGPVLSLLALLAEREVLHAGAVLLDGRLVAVTAPSGTGKSSTVAHMLAGGAQFFADDTVALQLVHGRLRAHAGPRLLSVYPEQLEDMDADGPGRLGEPLGGDDKCFFRPSGPIAPLPVSALVILERSTERPDPQLEPLFDEAPTLLASASLPWYQVPARARRQLEMAADVADTVPLYRLQVGANEPARSVAERLTGFVRGQASRAAGSAPQE